MTRTILAGFGLIALALPHGVANATAMQGNNCGSRNTVLDYLSVKYSEKPVTMGVAANGSLIEVLSSRKGATFTIIVTVPDGKTCMVAAGEGWEDLLGPVRKKKKKGSQT